MVGFLGSEELNDLLNSTFHVYGRTKNKNRVWGSLSRDSAALDSRNLPDQLFLADMIHTVAAKLAPQLL